MSSYIKGNARFTVITDGVIRMEYAEDGAFVDGKTMFAERNSESDAVFSDGNGILTIETSKISLRYVGEDEFSPENLFARIHTGEIEADWRFGDKNKENLGGTLSTLDGVCGFKELPDGLLSRDGWYVIDDSCKPVFSNGWIENRDLRHKQDYYLFAYGRDYKCAIRDLAAVSGKMEMPRKYFLGSWYSRWWPYTAEDFLRIADEYEENGFPLDILVMDMDWHYQDWGHQEGEPYALYGYGHAGQNLGWTGYTWNKRLIPDPDEFLAEIKKRKLAVTLNDHPADGIRDHEEQYPEFIRRLKEGGYREAVPAIEERISDRERENADRAVENYRFNAGSKVYMDAFFGSAHEKLEEQGVAFWWLDWQQNYLYPQVNGIDGLTHLEWLNHLYYEHSKKNGKRGQSFSRWAGFGDHKHPGYFSGDSVTGWDTLEFEIQMTVSAGNAGCFWWSHDIGGFLDPVEHGQGECYARWVQFGALSAALRVHMNGQEGLDRRPWTWGEPYCSSMRKAFALRSKLLPYIYSAAYESREKSIPLLRPLYLEEPHNEEAYKHPSSYMFGEGLFVSPICKEAVNGLAESDIWLPSGVWYDWFTGKRYESGSYKLYNDLDTFPLFAREGYPIVTQAYTGRMTSEALDRPVVVIYTGEECCGSTEIFEDDGISDLELGKYRLTKISYERSCEKNIHKLSLVSTGNGFAGEIPCRNYVINLFGGEFSAVCGSHKCYSSYNAENNMTVIEIENVCSGASVEIEIK